MRFVTECVTCGPVVVAPDATVLVTSGESAEAVFDCPLCSCVRTVEVSRGVRSALVVRGAAVVRPGGAQKHQPLTLADVAELQRLLADDDSYRHLFDDVA